MRFSGKVVIITGGAQGIGAGIARVFFRNGAKVVIADINEEAANNTIAALTDPVEHSEAVFVKCELRVEDDVKKMIDFTVSKFGRIDCLVNDAAIQPPLKAIDETTTEEFMEVIRVNVLGGFLCSKYALPHLRETRGSIVNISSVTDQTAQPGAVPYVTAKGALSAMSRALAVDEATHGVRVNTVCPGAVWTELNEKLSRGSNYEELRNTLQNLSLLGRCGLPEEVGEACLFFASEATFSTGASLLVSGGTELALARKSRVGLAPTVRFSN